MIRIKRAYDPPSAADGARVLVDRLWPRGCTKESLELAGWMKSVTPSSGLRKAFHSGALAFDAFADRYRAELALPGALEGIDGLADLSRPGPLTLITANRDERQNHALILKAVLEARLKKEQP